MDQKATQILFALLRCAIRDTKLTDDERNNFSPDALDDMIKMSSTHDVMHLLALGLKQNGLIPENNKEIEKEIFKAAYRYEQLNYEYIKLCKILEEASIPFIPLKGSILRDYYPRPWMRTSCDIDILVHKEDLEKAVSILVNEHGCLSKGLNSHDISLYTPSKTYLEMHYSLVEDGLANEASTVLESIWQTATVREGYSFLYDISDEMFYFYHIAHMAKHFEHGGCGIRPFIDLWILDKLPTAQPSLREDLLNKGKLLAFAQASQNLSKVWMEDSQPDAVSLQMQDFILRGGSYGTSENRVVVQQQKKGGRFKYALSKIFIPYEEIKFHYPILQKHRWLTPFMEVRRWFKLVFCGHAKRTLTELKYNRSISEEEAATTKKFLQSIGL